MNRDNASLCLPPNYQQRPDPVHFDDRRMRDEWQDEVYVYARRYAREHDVLRIIDWGCGSGYKLMKHLSGFRTTGYELEPSLSHLRARYPDRDWRSALTEEYLSADLLICADVIEHVCDPVHFMELLKRGPCQTFVLSTPALEILHERGQSPRLGPPNNESHVREWTTLEFRSFIEMHLRIRDHVVFARQGTQLVLAELK